jgi:hypothetical protein
MISYQCIEIDILTTVSKVAGYHSKKLNRSSWQMRLDNFLVGLQELLRTPIFTVSYLISAVLCLFSGHIFLSLSCLALCTYSRPDLIFRMHGLYREALQRYRLDPVLLTGIIFGLLAGVVLALAFIEPSHAQFFKNAETFINKAFGSSIGGGTGTGGLPGGVAGTTGGNGVIALVMNTLRLLFVMYMLFGIVQVFQAVRQGEEWKDLARTPFFVVLAGTLGDVLVGAITG